jgi:hypothetical protein
VHVQAGYCIILIRILFLVCKYTNGAVVPMAVRECRKADMTDRAVGKFFFVKITLLFAVCADVLH